MATVTAFIRTSKTDKNKSANVRFRLRDGRDLQLFHKSELSIIPDKWDEKLQKIKARCIIDEQERKTFDTDVNNRKALIKDIYLEKGKTLTSDALDVEIDKALHPEKYGIHPEATTVLKFFADFISTAHTRKDRKSGRLLSLDNIRNYKATERSLRELAEKMGKSDFEFSEMNKEFYDKFVAYLQSEITVVENGETKVIKKHYTLNTIGKHIKVLKLILNEAQAKGLCSIPNMKNIFYVFTEEADTVYLNEDELQQLKDKDLSEIPHLDRVRDQFLLLAWTGSRFSDLSKVTKSDIKEVGGDKYISFRQQKTNNKVTIPLHPVVIEIFEKYDYKLPPEISNQKFNKFIKMACQAAEINASETTTQTVGGKLITENFEKWQLVASHTGRRSFCTNMYKRGLPTIMIMSISGHTTEKAFLKYIKVKQEEHAEMMAKKWAEMYGSDKSTIKKRQTKKIK